MHVSLLDLHGFRDVSQQVASQRLREADRVQLVFGKGVGHDDRDQVLCDVPPGAPGLPQAEYDIGSGSCALEESVSLQGRSEIVGVVEDLGPLVLLEMLALVSGRVAVVDNGAAERRGIDVIADHLENEPPEHGLEELVGEGVRVADRKLDRVDLGRAKQRASALLIHSVERSREVRIEEYASSLIAVDGLSEDGDRAV